MVENKTGVAIRKTSKVKSHSVYNIQETKTLILNSKNYNKFITLISY